MYIMYNVNADKMYKNLLRDTFNFVKMLTRYINVLINYYYFFFSFSWFQFVINCIIFLKYLLIYQILKDSFLKQWFENKFSVKSEESVVF